MAALDLLQALLNQQNPGTKSDNGAAPGLDADGAPDDDAAGADQVFPSLVQAVRGFESGGRPNVVSPQGATGSMQIMPATFDDYARPGESYDNDRDRTSAAIRKLAADYRHYGGDLRKTAAAYIGGRGAVLADGTIREDRADAHGTTPRAYADIILGRMGKQGLLTPAQMGLAQPQDDGLADRVLAAGLAAKLPAPPPPVGSSNFVRGAKEAFQQLPQLGYGLLAGAGAQAENLFGEGGIASGIKQAGIAGYQDWEQRLAADAKPSDSFSYSYDQAKQGDFGALAAWLAHGIGYAGAQGVQMLATGGLGGLIGKAGLTATAEKLAAGLVAKESARLAATTEGAALSADALARQATANVCRPHRPDRRRRCLRARHGRRRNLRRPDQREQGPRP
jgi:hypothetical protein